MRVSTPVACVSIAALLAIGCVQETDTAANDDQSMATVQSGEAEIPDPPSVRLPVSINEAMVALVDYSSEPLWLDAYEPPTDEMGWLMAEYNAYQMALGGKVIQLAGTGPNDADWVVDPDWIRISEEMTDAGMRALRATQSRNVAELLLAGDDLVESCEACHKIFKPDLTSMGVYKSPKYPPDEE